jgi:FkbM family methyltransferase
MRLAAWTASVLPGWARAGIYRSGPLARLLRRNLNRAAPQGLVPVTVAAGLLQGMRLLLDLHSEKDYWLGTYEPELQAALSALVRPGMTAYDVGANIGYISLMLARLSGETGQVLAFEALPENVERLRANLALNGMQERVVVAPAAVVDQSGPVSFLVGPSGGMGKAQGSAGRQDVAYARSITITGYSLDEFAYQAGSPLPNLVKIDIEGGEVLALPGMRRLLQKARPLVLMELHGPQAAQVAWTTLQEAGYRICRMQPGFPGVAALAELDWKAYLVALPPTGSERNNH